MELKRKDTLALRFGFIQPNLSGLEGKILTIIEASIQDKVQCEAVKDLVKGEFRKTLDWLEEVACTDLTYNKKSYGQWGRPFPEETVKLSEGKNRPPVIKVK